MITGKGIRYAFFIFQRIYFAFFDYPKDLFRFSTPEKV